MFPAHKVAKVVVFLPKLSLCVLPHFCKSSFKKMQVQFASPLASPLHKIDHFGHKKGSPKAPQIPINYPLKAYRLIMSFQHAQNTLKNGVLSPYSSSVDTLLIRPPEISVDCLITARFVITVPFPPSPACSR